MIIDYFALLVSFQQKIIDVIKLFKLRRLKVFYNPICEKHKRYLDQKLLTLEEIGMLGKIYWSSSIKAIINLYKFYRKNNK